MRLLRVIRREPELPSIVAGALPLVVPQSVQEDTMSFGYKLLYWVGFTPWEEIAELPAVAQRFAALVAREEEECEPPDRRVLDLGCGSGIWGVELARRGWQVTGVDIVRKALRRARERAENAGVEMRLVEGDVTRLGAADVGSDYPFLIDLGLFHDELTDEQREAMGRGVTAVAAPGATLLMVAWAPGRRGPLPRGASRGDIEAAYPEWRVIDEERVDISGARIYRLTPKADPRLYRLRHE
jgi:SAM-dependent methyltransferase